MLDSESEYDLRTPNGKKAFRDAMNAAAYYSDRLSTRSARGKKLKAMAGEPNGSARPFGFEADLVTIREDEADDHPGPDQAGFLAGELQDALLAELNARGVRTSYGQAVGTTAACGRILHPPDATAAGSSTPTPRSGRHALLSAACRVSRSSQRRTSTGSAAIYAARRRGPSELAALPLRGDRQVRG